MKATFASMIAVCTFAILAACVTTPVDVYSGTWTLDVGQSGGNARTQVLTIAVQGNQETYRSELRLPEDRTQVTNYTATYDGKEYPSQTTTTQAGGAPVTRNDTVILRKISSHVRERHWKQGGRVVRILRREVSSDGTRLTSHVIELDEQGNEHVGGTLVFDRS